MGVSSVPKEKPNEAAVFLGRPAGCSQGRSGEIRLKLPVEEKYARGGSIWAYRIANLRSLAAIGAQSDVKLLQRVTDATLADRFATTHRRRCAGSR